MKKFMAMMVLTLVLALAGTNTVYAADENWSGTNPAEHYTISNGVITSDDSFIFLGPDNIGESKTNYFVTDEYTTTGDYTVSVDMQGSMGLPNDHEVKLGIVPYYLDENNFIYVYVHWATDDRPTDVRCVQFSGLLDGKPIALFDALNMEYLESRWNDCWCDGIQVPASENINITVDKTNAGENVIFSYVVSYGGGNVIGSGEYYLSAEHFAESGKVGVMACGEKATFSNFVLEEIIEEPEDTQTESEQDKTQDDEEKDNKDDEKTDDTSDGTNQSGVSIETIITIVAVVVAIAAVIVAVVTVKKNKKSE